MHPEFHEHYEATVAAQLPVSGFVLRLLAEELPMLDSTSRQQVMDILHEYHRSGGPVIETQEQLPAEIKEIMELY